MLPDDAVQIPATAFCGYSETTQWSIFSMKLDSKTNESDLYSIKGLNILGKNGKMDGSSFLGVILGIFAVALTSVNIILASAYIAQKNSRKHSVYKIVGAKNSFIGGLMIFESIIFLLFAFGLGCLVDYFLTRPLLDTHGVDLHLFDYVILFLINIVTVTLVTLINVVKGTKKLPAEWYSEVK